ncbi:MAG: hypothetical protein GY707_13960, partial [Desulfobacteraceae bacterium]|nr:hypothetical protein [Desulfobacteraceae bacterium]
STLLAYAGDLDSPADPSNATSAMYQLEDIYNRLDNGTEGSKRSGAFTEPTSSPGRTGYTLDEIMGKTPLADNTNGAVPSEVLNNKTYWGLRTDGSWGSQTGTMANVDTQSITPGVASQTITLGYHSGSGSVDGDSDLVTGNIKSGVSIFGVAGDSNVVNTSTGDAAAG